MSFTLENRPKPTDYEIIEVADSDTRAEVAMKIVTLKLSAVEALLYAKGKYDRGRQILGENSISLKPKKKEACS
jgi:hypothetical protein